LGPVKWYYKYRSCPWDCIAARPKNFADCRMLTKQ
jgi:hypothetical protein